MNFLISAILLYAIGYYDGKHSERARWVRKINAMLDAREQELDEEGSQKSQ